ncbi:Iron(3+)-hydroxamate import ATP-binding protein FhuC [Nocardia otitidiscaviarum]|uniref:Iron(3+)-hydroxamate import ATP-binding protein FhuC n=1 Tax=Nocardia otitidiscaviarum TaxID=1823 RepID=A0A379JG82_9NOCA|nr:zinc ABC transporter ATP-binding protein AztA [Nocardia otitidiscaviarum]SUD47444.1 Iron(3+)-hydroxamate import ATP-binding protein FhuC [Nocardia otitidiscaviarum]
MNDRDTAAVRLRGLTAGYRSRAVLHEITADIPAGRVTALVGHNGSGKSTLLGVLAGVITPSAGTAERTGGRRPALVVQQGSVPSTLPITVRETVAMGRWAHRGPWRRLTRDDRRVVADCLERMGIAHLAARRLTDLSGGQRQRALLARALAQEADLLLLDEPAVGLDIEAQQQISRTIRETAASGVTVVHATHDRAEALGADHCLLMRDGGLADSGAPERVLATAPAAEPPATAPTPA